MQIKKKMSVKEFTKLVGHHSEGNIRVFRERLRFHNVIKNNEPLTEDLVAVWNEICKAHKQGATWVEAMDSVITTHEVDREESKTKPAPAKLPYNDQKLDEVIFLLKEILSELRK